MSVTQLQVCRSTFLTISVMIFDRFAASRDDVNVVGSVAALNARLKIADASFIKNGRMRSWLLAFLWFLSGHASLLTDERPYLISESSSAIFFDFSSLFLRINSSVLLMTHSQSSQIGELSFTSLATFSVGVTHNHCEMLVAKWATLRKFEISEPLQKGNSTYPINFLVWWWAGKGRGGRFSGGGGGGGGGGGNRNRNRLRVNNHKALKHLVGHGRWLASLYADRWQSHGYSMQMRNGWTLRNTEEEEAERTCNTPP